ncbi:MAG: type II toxin-antitoxin system HicB family antitoxin [Beijerinckiaceae bacterium]|nr:type II toxin-antitoxin system HicB family antitoxin [Beijerinckiaceae bacterium]
MPDRINLKIRMEDGAFWATVEEFPGVFATGDNLEELRASLEEGIALYVAKPGEDVRPVQLPPLEPADTVASAALAFA